MDGFLLAGRAIRVSISAQDQHAAAATGGQGGKAAYDSQVRRVLRRVLPGVLPRVPPGYYPGYHLGHFAWIRTCAGSAHA
eukprot:5902452-Pleurochrysis_carterae.AAC.1